jgi:hypothetical protein
MKNQLKPKYPFQRVEKRRTTQTDTRSLKERAQMERLSATKISIGTFNIFPPKPETEIKSFTLAFSTPIPKHELYLKLHEAFNSHWDGEPTKTIYVHLSKPLPLNELRQRIRKSLSDSTLQNT